ncbi:MAG: hypothetical protein QM727_09300 [Niabella sp.]
MKYYIRCFFLILFYFNVTKGLGQYKPDTTISKKEYDSLRQRINELYGKNKLQEYKLRLVEELKQVDTVYKNADSLSLSFISTKGQVIKKQMLHYQNGAVVDSTLLFYNKNGLIEYAEEWYLPLASANGTKDSFRLRIRYRNEYDAQNRLIKYVFFLPTPILKRKLYAYDEAGKRIRLADDSGFYFWD